ncbi:MAG: hypothetical protein LBD68_08285 [Zoogloeaceae bacterium]|jgi:hypothetical protein|nr:hypothetical protein [Zoogloeaceae bacterium]
MLMYSRYAKQKRRVPEWARTAALIAFFLLAFGIVGRLDYETAVATEAAAFRCENENGENHE